MTNQLIQSSQFLSQYFDYEFLIPKDKLTAGLLASVALYTDRYQLNKNYNQKKIASHEMCQNLIPFGQGFINSKDRIAYIIDEPATMNLARNIEKELARFSQKSQMFRHKIFITIANIFGAVFKVFSENSSQVYGSISNTSIYIYIYTCHYGEYMVFPLDYYNMDPNFLHYIQVNAKKVIHCGHDLSKLNLNSGKCADCSQVPYQLEKKIINLNNPSAGNKIPKNPAVNQPPALMNPAAIPNKIPNIPALNQPSPNIKNPAPNHKPQKPSLNQPIIKSPEAFQDLNPVHAPPKANNKNSKNCSDCKKSRKNKCSSCHTFFCDNHKQVDLCLICGGNPDILLDQDPFNPNGLNPLPFDPPKGTTHHPVSASPFQPPGTFQQGLVNNDPDFISFSSRSSSKFLKKFQPKLFMDISVNKILRAFLSNPSNRNELVSQKIQRKNRRIIQVIQNVINNQNKTKLDPISQEIMTEIDKKYSGKNAQPKYLQFLDLVYLLSIKVVVLHQGSLIKFGKSFKNNRWWHVFIEEKSTNATTCIKSERKEEIEFKKIIDRKIENHLKKIDEENKGKNNVYFICGCKISREVIFNKTFIEIKKIQCNDHNKKLSKFEEKFIIENYHMYHAGCCKCNFVNKSFIRCSVCKFSFCDEECSDDIQDKFNPDKNGIIKCIVCKSKLNISGVINSIEIKILDMNEEALTGRGDNGIISTETRDIKCLVCKKFEAKIEGKCKICKYQGLNSK